MQSRLFSAQLTPLSSLEEHALDRDCSFQPPESFSLEVTVGRKNQTLEAVWLEAAAVAKQKAFATKLR